MALVGPGVAEVRHDRRDARGGRAAARIGESEQLHQVVIDRRRGRLHQEDLFPANRLAQLHRDLSVRKAVDDAVSETDPEVTSHSTRQRRVGGTREDRELLAHVAPGPPSRPEVP
jgi:hypothetical protein